MGKIKLQPAAKYGGNREVGGGAGRQQTRGEQAEAVVFGFIIDKMNKSVEHGQWMKESALINICLGGGCPSPEHAQRGLERMVRRQMLEKKIDRSTDEQYYRVVTENIN
jgi:hypothetical protein